MNTAPIADEEKEKIFHGNAERVFHIPARTKIERSGTTGGSGPRQ